MPHPKQKKDAYTVFLESVGSLWESGYGIDWERFHRGHVMPHVSLPTYSFDHKVYEVSREFSQDLEMDALPITKDDSEQSMMLGKMQDIWKLILDLKK